MISPSARMELCHREYEEDEVWHDEEEMPVDVTVVYRFTHRNDDEIEILRVMYSGWNITKYVRKISPAWIELIEERLTDKIRITNDEHEAEKYFKTWKEDE